jgi:hypothetical protein
MYAEAVLNLSPWEYYTKTDRIHVKDTLTPAVTALRRALTIDPKHLLALHLWIHLTESSDNPAAGEKEADMLYSIGKSSRGNEEQLSLLSATTNEGKEDNKNEWLRQSNRTTIYETSYDTSNNSSFIISGSGHLLHMPAHLFLRLGRYKDAVDASILAVANDRMYEQHCLVPYVPSHNEAMLVNVAVLSGR